MKPKVTWVEFVEELRRCFSDSKTRVHAAAIYNEFRRQDDNENLVAFWVTNPCRITRKVEQTKDVRMYT